MKEGTTISGRQTPFEQIIGPFIAHVKNKAELLADKEINAVVAGRPVHFVDGNEKADQAAQSQLKSIFAAAGFNEIRFQYEPIAAAFAHELNLGEEERLAVVMDIGGGTSDFTIMRLSGRSIQKTDRQDDILANAGVRIGGNDFDRALSLSCFMPLVGMGSTWGAKGLDFPRTPFFDLAELSKIQYMYTRKYKRDLFALISQSTQKTLTQRLRFIVQEESLLGNLLSIQQTINACLVQAGVKAEAIGLVILTGGGTAMPILQNLTRQLFPLAEIADGNRLSSVGFGLACDAKRYFL
jgi:hypothetical chaperone protein